MTCNPNITRRATSSDLPAVMHLIGSNLDTLLPRSTEELAQLLDTMWVVEEVNDAAKSNEIVGCSILEVYSPKIAEVRSVAVRADRRGRGYGRALVEAALKEAESRGIRQVLAVTSSLEFFKNLNFGACLNEKYALFWNGTDGDTDGNTKRQETD